MAFYNGCFASVWEITPAEKYTEAKITISKKNQATGKYIQDFTGTVRFIGDAHIKIQKYPHAPAEGERKPVAKIRMDAVSATVTSYKPEGSDKAVWYHNYQCYSFTDAAEAAAPDPASTKTTMENIPDDVDEELPFN